MIVSAMAALILRSVNKARPKHTWLWLSFVFLALQPLEADWQPVDAFDSYLQGRRLTDTVDWQAGSFPLNRSFDAYVRSNPQARGKVLEFQKTGLHGGEAVLVRSGETFPAGGTQTFYLRFRFDAARGLPTGNAVREFAGVALVPGLATGVFDAAYGGFGVGDVDNSGRAMRLAGPNMSHAAPGPELKPGAWYEAWLVLEDGEIDLYFQSQSDGSFASQIPVAGNFRGAADGGDLMLALFANQPDGPRLTIDAVYRDGGRRNLSRPEPLQGLVIQGEDFRAPDGAEPGGGTGNVIVILIDDLGWKDLGSYGGEVFETPRIDALAQAGMRFTNAYASCSVCAPTRASLMSGKYPGRLHFTALNNHHKQLGNVEENPERIKLIQPAITNEDGLKESEYTLARAFRDAGYRTALFGKTHFGSGGEDLNALGFDGFANPDNDMWITPPAIVESDPKRMVTITDMSIDFMRESHERDKPFFLYVSHNAVHVQVQTTREYFEKHQTLMTSREKEIYSVHYVAMVEELDREIGRLLDAVASLGLAEETAIIFTSDNGGVEEVITQDPYRLTSMEPLRGQKGGQYEGAHRVPLIVKWPGRTAPGSASGAVATTPDLFPTALEMAGLPLRPEQHVDGVSLAPVLRGGGTLERDAVYWHKPHYYVRNTPLSVIREGKWKYILYWETLLSPHGGPPHELFDLEADIGETNNLAGEKPEIAQRLRLKLLEHLLASECEIPAINPAYLPPSER